MIMYFNIEMIIIDIILMFLYYILNGVSNLKYNTGISGNFSMIFAILVGMKIAYTLM
jgi:hypothetical protein